MTLNDRKAEYASILRAIQNVNEIISSFKSIDRLVFCPGDAR